MVQDFRMRVDLLEGGIPGREWIEREAEGSSLIINHLIKRPRRRRTMCWTGWRFAGSGTPGTGAREVIAGSPMCATSKGSRGNVVKERIMLPNTSEGDGTISGVEEGSLEIGGWRIGEETVQTCTADRLV